MRQTTPPDPAQADGYALIDAQSRVLVPSTVWRQHKIELSRQPTAQDTQVSSVSGRGNTATAAWGSEPEPITLAESPGLVRRRPSGRRHDAARIEQPLYDVMQAAVAWQRLPKVQHPNERQALQEVLLKDLVEGCPLRRVAMPAARWRGHMAQLRAAFPNFAEPLDAIERHLQLVRRAGRALPMPPICLVGEPGLGKTQFAQTLSLLLRAPLHRVQFEVSDSASVLIGTERQCANAHTGTLYNALVRGPAINPVVLLDELDKATERTDRATVLDALHKLLEPHSACAFRDRCLPEVALDASLVQWIATANEAERLPRSLRSRLREFHIPPLTPDQARTIIASLDTELRKVLRLKSMQPLPEDMIQQLSTLSPRRAKQALRELYGLLLVRGERHFGQPERDLLAEELRSQPTRKSPRDVAQPHRMAMLDVMFLSTVAALRALDLRTRSDEETQRLRVSRTVH